MKVTGVGHLPQVMQPEVQFSRGLLGGLLVPMRASLAANLYFLASRAGFPAHFKDQVFTSETNKDPGAPNPFGGNAALPFMDSSRTARTLEARRPPGWPSPVVLERGRRKSKSLA